MDAQHGKPEDYSRMIDLVCAGLKAGYPKTPEGEAYIAEAEGLNVPMINVRLLADTTYNKHKGR